MSNHFPTLNDLTHDQLLTELKDQDIKIEILKNLLKQSKNQIQDLSHRNFFKEREMPDERDRRLILVRKINEVLNISR